MSTLHVHRVEDEELGLGAEVGGVAQAGGLEVGLGALGDGARVAVVGLPSVGSITSQVMISVGSSVNGSMRTLSGSGMSSMSEAWMPFQPAIDEPSKA